MNFAKDDELVRHLAAYLKDQWNREKKSSAQYYAGVDGDEDAARAVIKKLLRLFDDGQIVPPGGRDAFECLLQVTRLLDRALKVDMTDPANRKGELPKALGLVSAKDGERRMRDRAIYFTFDHARYRRGTRSQGRIRLNGHSISVRNW